MAFKANVEELIKGYKEALKGASGMTATSLLMDLNGLIRQQEEGLKEIIIMDPKQEYKVQEALQYVQKLLENAPCTCETEEGEKIHYCDFCRASKMIREALEEQEEYLDVENPFNETNKEGKDPIRKTPYLKVVGYKEAFEDGYKVVPEPEPRYSIIDMVCSDVFYDISNFKGVSCMNEKVNEQHLLNLFKKPIHELDRFGQFIINNFEDLLQDKTGIETSDDSVMSWLDKELNGYFQQIIVLISIDNGKWSFVVNLE